MTKSSNGSELPNGSRKMLARLESMGRGEGPLARALRRQQQEAKAGVVRPTALVTYDAPSQKDPNDIL